MVDIVSTEPGEVAAPQYCPICIAGTWPKNGDIVFFGDEERNIAGLFSLSCAVVTYNIETKSWCISPVSMRAAKALAPERYAAALQDHKKRIAARYGTTVAVVNIAPPQAD